jgi:hypothetical protein
MKVKINEDSYKNQIFLITYKKYSNLTSVIVEYPEWLKIRRVIKNYNEILELFKHNRCFLYSHDWQCHFSSEFFASYFLSKNLTIKIQKTTVLTS